jgi:hypothetical protein
MHESLQFFLENLLSAKRVAILLRNGSFAGNAKKQQSKFIIKYDFLYIRPNVTSIRVFVFNSSVDNLLQVGQMVSRYATRLLYSEVLGG